MAAHMVNIGAYVFLTGTCNYEAFDPSLRDRTSGVEVGTATYAYATADLRGMAALLYEQLKQDSHRLPAVPPSKTFPYHAQGGMLYGTFHSMAAF